MDNRASCRRLPTGGGTDYTLFRRQSGGEWETAGGLCARAAPSRDGDLRPCPYYEVDGEEVEEASARLEELITRRTPGPSAWTPIEPRAE